ncbi:hypothetical protein J437_LFUL015704 [Ladona fulva]|uniref:cyclin-dependent kinase n=1 Tax=Ladona fulva TaxID=123851 RepID=A0A8K0KMN0_LADFU|nr:hypothetical protein J437_LFUL015704 [Ladona fulva]
MYCQVDKNSSNSTSKGKDGVVAMREKKGGALSRVQKLKKRLSHSFGRLAISKEDNEDASATHVYKVPYNGYSDEFLDRLEPNGNIPVDKDLRYGECGREWVSSHQFHQHQDASGVGHIVQRQLSVSSDSKLLDDEVREETARVVMRPRKPPRPKSEAFLLERGGSGGEEEEGGEEESASGGGVKNRTSSHHHRHRHGVRRTKRYSAFGGDSPFGKSEAYIKLEQLGEGSYATVFKGYSNLTNQVVALKEIRLQEEEGTPFTAIREASLLKELKHANIVTLHDIIHTRETLTFVFEYVHTDLSQYMDKYGGGGGGGGGGLDHGNVRLFLFQLLRGLAYCHRRRVLHRDVKPQNLLISEIGELKLADFEDDKILGTPNEETWRGVSRLPGYKPHKLCFYKGQKLGMAFPRLYDLNPNERIGAEAALKHRYFSCLPKKLYELPDEISIFSVENIALNPEGRMKAAT